MVLDGQREAVIFQGLWRLQVSKTLLYVMNHSVNVSRLGFDFLSTSKPSFSVIRFSHSLSCYKSNILLDCLCEGRCARETQLHL
jgi:hypothetical protein